jgi:hypothetical protein
LDKGKTMTEEIKADAFEAALAANATEISNL